MVVHIAGNLMSSDVHKHIIDGLDVCQSSRSTVIVPAKRSQHARKLHLLDWRADILFCETPRWVRYFPVIKQLLVLLIVLIRHRRLVKDAKKIYGHSLWTDGFLCWALSRYSQAQYYLFVRNTDLNVFFRIPWIRALMKVMVARASRVFVPSKAYFHRMASAFDDTPRKVKLIPNGIDQYWHENFYSDALNAQRRDLIFVGKADGNKNLKKVFAAVCLSKKKSLFEHFHVVGLSESEFFGITGVKTPPGWVSVHGIVDKVTLLGLYRRSRILVLPSFKETFGLVYLEAITQGCAVICSRGQGLSNELADYDFCETVNPASVGDIEEKISRLFKSPIGNDRLNLLQTYNWQKICMDLCLAS